MDTDLQHLQPEIDRLHAECLSLMMATLNQNAEPNASYTPFAWLNNHFYILVSGLATHTLNLQQNPNLAVLLIDDESKTKNIYARVRLTYQVTAQTVDKNSEEYAYALAALAARAGKTAELVASLPDFVMYRLLPLKGTLVQGFGKAFVFDPVARSGATQLTDRNINQLR
ncbi:HugZ family protein [Advenella sp. RU8]|uniref:HugZ family pyridoxamine 5'-phosphate oxidase n=1 Tax=Advenella sp. RU8 TaxID=3399575 RepID=UPI003AAD2892